MSSSIDNLQNLFEYSPEALFLESLEGDIIHVNDRACDMLGYTDNELINMKVEDLIPPGSPRFEPEVMDQALAKGEKLESLNYCKDGSVLPIELKGQLIELDGKQRLLVSIRDITDRRSSEEKLKSTQQRLHKAMKSGNLAWWEMELPSGEIAFDDVKATLLGYSPKHFEHYTDFTELIHPADYKKTMEAMEDHLKGRKDRYEVEYRIKKNDGRYKWFRDVGRITKKDGEYVKITGIVSDIDERRKYQHKLEKREKELNSIVANTADAIGMVDEEGKIRFWNDRAEEMFGYSKEEVYGRRIDNLIMPEDYAKRFRRGLNKFHETGKGDAMGKAMEVDALRKDQTTFPAEVSHSSFKLGSKWHAIAIIRDISEKKQAEQALTEKREKVRQLHDAVDRLQQQDTEEDVLQTAIDVAENMLNFEICAISVAEGDYLVPKVNSTGLPPDETTTFKIGEGIAGKTVQFSKTIWGKDVRNHPAAKPTNKEFRAFISSPIGKLGNLQVISKEVGVFDETDVELTEILTGHLHEELKRVRLEKKLREQAIKDTLTGLYNRRYLSNTLPKEAERAKRYNNPLAFIMIDINHFKNINDRYSHQTGDKVLQEIALLLKANVRSADTVVRYGGDEFLIIMPETDGEAEVTVTRLKKELDKWNETSDLLDFPINLAMGVSHWDSNQHISVEQALNQADDNMYKEKRR